MSFITSTQNITTYRQKGTTFLDSFKESHSLLIAIVRLSASQLVGMSDSKVDTDGYTESIRRHIVDTAASRVRKNGIEPHPDLLLLYERYIKGEICREELHTQIQNRLAKLIDHLQHQRDQGQQFE